MYFHPYGLYINKTQIINMKRIHLQGRKKEELEEAFKSKLVYKPCFLDSQVALWSVMISIRES